MAAGFINCFIIDLLRLKLSDAACVPASPAHFLDWRTGDRSKGTKYAAVALPGPEQFAAPFTVIEKLAGIYGHNLRFLMATVGAGNDRSLRT
jgi:hypothetical protein